MIFGLLKLLVWLAGVAVITYFLLPFFGYEVNVHYWEERKVVCEEKLAQCRKDLVKKGLEGAKESCNFKCVDPQVLIKKR